MSSFQWCITSYLLMRTIFNSSTATDVTTVNKSGYYDRGLMDTHFAVVVGEMHEVYVHPLLLLHVYRDSVADQRN